MLPALQVRSACDVLRDTGALSCVRRSCGWHTADSSTVRPTKSVCILSHVAMLCGHQADGWFVLNVSMESGPKCCYLLLFSSDVYLGCDY